MFRRPTGTHVEKKTEMRASNTVCPTVQYPSIHCPMNTVITDAD